jgi:hypothetical protein
MAAYKIGLLTIYGTKKHRGKITCKILVQYRYCLKVNAIFSNLAPLQFCGCHIKEILLFKKLNVWPLEIILWIRKFNYMEISIYFHLL